MSDVSIVGGGLSGLVCGKLLCEAGVSCQIFEAADSVGGRIRTDLLDGFRLDRGFQVFLTAYPEARLQLDYQKLQLCLFEPGALIRYAGKFHRLSDPWRRPQHLLATAISPVASLADKLRIAGFRKQTSQVALSTLYERPETTTIELLSQRGFSPRINERFFRPFLGGVFLDRDLMTSSRLCEFVFRMFSLGDAALPAYGMQMIPDQLASRLPADVVRTASRVDWIDGTSLGLASGERVESKALVVATDAPTARRLLHDPLPAGGRSVSCLYFAAGDPPLLEPILVLNGDGEGPINNLCFPSQVSPHYAPATQSLVSVTVVGGGWDEDELIGGVRRQLFDWYGTVTQSWRHLRTYHIPYALPIQSPPALQPVAKSSRVSDRVFMCGDHCDTASINGAMASGRRAAEAILRALA